MYLYLESVLRIWDFVLKLSKCMLILNVGIVIICSIIIILIFFVLFRVLRGCCLVVMYLGGEMSPVCVCVAWFY